MLSNKGKIWSSYRGKRLHAHLSKLISPTFFFVLKCSSHSGLDFRASGPCTHCLIFLE